MHEGCDGAGSPVAARFQLAFGPHDLGFPSSFQTDRNEKWTATLVAVRWRRGGSVGILQASRDGNFSGLTAKVGGAASLARGREPASTSRSIIGWRCRHDHRRDDHYPPTQRRGFSDATHEPHRSHLANRCSWPSDGDILQWATAATIPLPKTDSTFQVNLTRPTLHFSA